MDGQKHNKSLLDCDSETINTYLRRPHSSNTTIQETAQFPNSNAHTTYNKPEIKTSTFTLSALAKEFVPAAVRKTSAQDRLVRCKSETNSDSNKKCPNETIDQINGYEKKLQETIDILIDDPGQFDHVLGQFLATLEPYFHDLDVQGYVAQLIFGMAIDECNFRYSAARLCRILEEQSPIFKAALHLFTDKQCQTTPDNCDLALTLAEVYAQSDCDNIYGNHVVQLLGNIVSKGNHECVKCVCQVLKLAGASLDIHHSTKLTLILKELDSVKNKLPTLKNLINYVIGLRASNWGQAESNSSSSVLIDGYYNDVDSPIFYGPDGKELSEEEKQFLSENCVDIFNDDLVDPESDELFDPDNEMNEEVWAAYREFTKNQ